MQLVTATQLHPQNNVQHGLVRMLSVADSGLLDAKLQQILDPNGPNALAIQLAYARLIGEVVAITPNRFKINAAKKAFANAFVDGNPTLEKTSFSLTRQAVQNIALSAGIDIETADFV